MTPVRTRTLKPWRSVGDSRSMLGKKPLRRLKESTAALHQEAERHVHLLDPGATVNDYIGYLRAFHAFHAAAEPHLRALNASGFESSGRARAALACEDLAALGAEPGPACAWSPARADVPSLLGVAYVLEGSTLGGRFILAKVPPSIAALRGHATRFLEGHAAETGARWRAFGAIVERELHTDPLIEAACMAACETFRALIGWLTEASVHARARKRAS